MGVQAGERCLPLLDASRESEISLVMAVSEEHEGSTAGDATAKRCYGLNRLDAGEDHQQGYPTGGGRLLSHPLARWFWT
jgi:hypothetical protein